ncbi:hypothetical protein [Aliirhizobium cellulosilyticum]|uniref:Uncharacterized protein n=1 Tax=Aliirhizobium cellulosilyticum TaxID=393664 RepID=A0A7W6WP40_9HYPH|nr:hypothetical protein [Rhizobium cellulosilyticum]MBB4348003.1 hypothetical protein [Rhizobium cellulosilyticum]MBB4409603.1 hypothetical protein [Rhizobium cellulosilyticum]MBB4444291.1 hypothetical protein [Rhizobium cellulosilyticum]
MSFYALTDSDWSWDDEGEGRAIVVHADTPQDAIRIATEKHIAENPGAGGICWKIARLWDVGFEMVEWEDDNKPKYIGFCPYPDGSNGPMDTPPVSTASLPDGYDDLDTPLQKAASGTNYMGFAVESVTFRGRKATIVDRDFPIGTPITVAGPISPSPQTSARGITPVDGAR